MKQCLGLLIWCSLFSGHLPVLTARSGDEATHPRVALLKQEGKVTIAVGGRSFAAYHYRHEQISRPFLANVHAPGGVKVTRNFPVRKDDLQDHDTFHPGIHLAFADINGHDYWRLKARVVHERFLAEPKDAPGRAELSLRNAYLDGGGKPVCTETCSLSFAVRPSGYLIVWDSTLIPAGDAITFGDQEEMGLAVRVATPLAVVKGGRLRDSAGRVNEKQVWGKTADWCDYAGPLHGKHAGLTVMPDPKNFRPSWFHARDYGLLAANPFGRRAFTRGEKSRVTVRRGESLRLRFGVLAHAHDKEADYDPRAAYKDFLGVLEGERGMP